MEVKAVFNKVSRSNFNALCDKLAGSYGFVEDVYLQYNGTSRYGDLIITECPGHMKEYLNALKSFVDIYCR